MAYLRASNVASQPLQLHGRYRISDRGLGEVLFVGQTSFSVGVWVGVQLDEPKGWNNGTIRGKCYFRCEDNFGVFVRPSSVYPLTPGEDEQQPGMAMGRDGSVAESPDLKGSYTTIPAPRPSGAVDGMQMSAFVQSLAGRPESFMSRFLRPTVASLRDASEAVPLQREVEELREKVRILEKKAEEDREKMQDMERAKVEAEKVVAMKPQMDARIEELQAQVSDLRKLEKNWSVQKDDFEHQVEELNGRLESQAFAQFDAQDKLEEAKKELKEAKKEIDDLRIEARDLREDVYKLEDDLARVQRTVEHLELDKATMEEDMAKIESNEANREGTGSVAFVRVSRLNQELKNDLQRARDALVEKEAHHREKLDKELAGLRDLQSSYDKAVAVIEDLKEQIDALNDADHYVLNLVCKNMKLEDKAAALQAANEGFATVKELSDKARFDRVAAGQTVNEDLEAPNEFDDEARPDVAM